MFSFEYGINFQKLFTVGGNGRVTTIFSPGLSTHYGLPKESAILVLMSSTI